MHAAIDRPEWHRAWGAPVTTMMAEDDDGSESVLHLFLRNGFRKHTDQRSVTLCHTERGIVNHGHSGVVCKEEEGPA